MGNGLWFDYLNPDLPEDRVKPIEPPKWPELAELEGEPAVDWELLRIEHELD